MADVTSNILEHEAELREPIRPAKLFRPIPDHEGYYVSPEGEILSGRSVNGRSNVFERASRLRRVKTTFNSCGYPVVGMQTKEGQKTRRIHRLVLETYVGPCPPGMECCHADCDPANSNLENLRWADHTENMSDSIRLGRIKVGESRPLSKLTGPIVMEILNLRASGLKLYEIAAKYGVATATIHRVCRGGSWRHVPISRLPVKRIAKKTSPERVAEYVRLREAGYSLKDISIKFGVGVSTISNVCSKHRRKVANSG